MQWSIEEKDKMICLLKEGKSISDVASYLNRSVSSVWAKYKIIPPIDNVNIATKPPKWTSEDHEKTRALWRSGMLTSQIAKVMNRTVHSIAGRIREHRNDFPERSKLDTFVDNRITSSFLKEKPTPENTVIEYEYEEIPVPENAPLVSYMDLKAHKCKWICDDFWTEFDSDKSKCCGLDVHDKNGSAMQRNYCNRHYKASVRSKD